MPVAYIWISCSQALNHQEQAAKAGDWTREKNDKRQKRDVNVERADS